MPINNPDINAFSGKVILSRTSVPNSTVCSGIKFENNALTTETISHAIDGRKYPTQDFMEVRQNGVLDSGLCLLPGYGNIQYELISCKNRFGGALYREVGKIGAEYERLTYDERCVGYKTLSSGVSLTNTWQDEHVLYFSGISQDTLNLINGPCVPGELEQEYTISASANNCSGKLPCAELRKLVCRFDSTASTPTDPACGSINNNIPYSLFQNNYFCSVRESVFPRIINAFCSVDPYSIKLQVLTAKYCEIIPTDIVRNVPEFKYCSIDGAIIRSVIEEVTFCETDTIFIREEIEVVSVKYCSTVQETIAYELLEVKFCEIGDIVSELKYCSLPRGIVAYASVDAKYCSIPRDTVAYVSVDAKYCSIDESTII